MRSVRIYRKTLIAAFAVTISPSALAEADPARPDSLETVVVTAKAVTEDALHLDAPAADLPIAIQTVPIQIIEDEGLVRLGDAVRNVSGVTRKEAYFGLTDSFNIRGFDASTGLFNGFRYDYYSSVVDLAHVESVEVIKGPASVTTGFLEPGGVVNVITKRPVTGDLGEINLSGGSFGRARLQGDVSHEIDDTLAVRITGAIERTDSFRDYVGSKRGTIGAAIDWKPTSTTKIELSSYYEDLYARPDRGLPNDPIALNISPDRFFGEPTDTYHLQQYQNSATIEQQLIDGLSLRGGFDWARSLDLRKNTQAIALQPDGRTFSRDYTIVPGSEDTKTAFIEGNGQFDTGIVSHRLSAGVDWTQQAQVYDFLDTDVLGSFVTPIDIYDPVYGVAPPGPVGGDGNFRGVTQDVGFYANDLISLADFKLLLGVRHDAFRYHDRDLDYLTTTQFNQVATTPRVGLVYQPVEGVSIYANYAESFNPQQFTRLASGIIPAPSQGEQKELGVKYESADQRWTASLAGYEIYKTNVATPDPNDPTGTFSVLSGEERSRGIEFDGGARPIPGLQTVLALTLMNAEVTRDNVLPVGDGLVNVPHGQATLWARYDIPETPYGVGGTIYYVGRREATLPNSFTIPSYTRCDLAFFWRPMPKLEFAVNLQNVTDTRYYDSQDNSLFPGAPLSVLSTIRLTF